MNYQLSHKMNSNVNTSFHHSKNARLIWSQLYIIITHSRYYQALHMTSDQFLALSNLALKVVSAKIYSKVGIILEVNIKVVVKTWMTRRSIADYTNTSQHGFACFILHPSFKRPFFVGKNSNLLNQKSGFDVLFGGEGGFMKNVRSKIDLRVSPESSSKSIFYHFL